MNHQSTVTFRTEDGNDLHGVWSPPNPNTQNYPLVILATGDGPNGSKGQTWQQLVPILNEVGIGTFLFDFAGLGYSPGDYASLTLSRGCRDFRAAVNYAQSHGSHDRSRLGAIGSSFGGNVILLEAAKFPEIKAIGLKSASTFLAEGYEFELGHDKMNQWGQDGFLSEVGHTYDIVLDSLLLNTYAAAASIQAPVRIVHGTADSSVPIRHARDLLRILPNGSMLEIPGADHWYAEGDEWATMAHDLVRFMVEHLLPAGRSSLDLLDSNLPAVLENEAKERQDTATPDNTKNLRPMAGGSNMTLLVGVAGIEPATNRL